jgi:transposase
MTAQTKATSGPGRGRRMSRQHKREVVLRLLRGEDLETASRSLGVTAAALAEAAEPGALRDGAAVSANHAE